MNIRPLGHNLLVEPVKRKVESGPIVVPDSVLKEGPQLYRVIAIGSKVEDVPVGCLAVCHSYYEGPTDLPDGRKIVKDKQVLALL